MIPSGRNFVSWRTLGRNSAEGSERVERLSGAGSAGGARWWWHTLVVARAVSSAPADLHATRNAVPQAHVGESVARQRRPKQSLGTRVYRGSGTASLVPPSNDASDNVLLPSHLPRALIELRAAAAADVEHFGGGDVVGGSANGVLRVGV